MSKSGFRYDRMMDDAVRGVIAKLLGEAATRGMPDQHHFLITFRTGCQGVDIADELRTRYPQEMTIILQHQFWDLKIDETKFSVTLSFNKVPQRLVVPYVAITAFADPSVRWGIKLQPREPEGDAVPLALADKGSVPDAGEGFRRLRGAGNGEAKPSASPSNTDESKVVTLDTFRRK